MERAWAVKNNKGQEVICQCHCKPFDYLETVLKNEKCGFIPKGLYSSKDMVEHSFKPNTDNTDLCILVHDDVGEDFLKLLYNKKLELENKLKEL